GREDGLADGALKIEGNTVRRSKGDAKLFYGGDLFGKKPLHYFICRELGGLEVEIEFGGFAGEGDGPGEAAAELLGGRLRGGQMQHSGLQVVIGQSCERSRGGLQKSGLSPEQQIGERHLHGDDDVLA